MIVMLGMGYIGLVHAQISKSNQYDLIIGTYTNKDKTSGIHVYAFNSKTGEFSFKSKAQNITNPSYLAVTADKKNLYSVSEAGGGSGSIYAYSFDAPSGKLTLLNNVSSGGDGPCYVSVDDKKQHVFVGNYSGGSLTAVRINEDGSLSSDSQTFQHEGSSVYKPNQDKPHVHAAVIAPDGRYLLVPDLGTDKINIYSIEGGKALPLKPAAQPFVSIKAGGGPRHLTFHPNGKFAYLVQELDGMVTAFTYNDGKLEAIQSLTMLSDGFTGKVGAADIHTSPDGRFLYASNRGDANEIVIYAINKEGKLNYAGRQSTLGKTPRNFAIDPSGNYLLAANQGSDEIILFKRDQKTGLLTPTGAKITVSMPVCLKFIPI
jgi:6-phosphogluconolactonase